MKIRTSVYEVGDIILNYSLVEKMDTDQIWEAMKGRGYEITKTQIVDYLREAELNSALFQRKELGRMMVSAVRELSRQVNDAKRYIENFEINDDMTMGEKSKRMKYLSIAHGILNKAVNDVAKITGEIQEKSLNISTADVVNIAQIKSYFFQEFMRLVDEGKVVITDEDLKADYDRLKRSPHLLGRGNYDYNISESVIP